MTSIRTMLLAALSLTLGAAPHAQSDAAADIRAARARSNQGLASRSIQAFSETLADDVVMIRGSGVVVPTRQGYIDLIADDFKNPDAFRYVRTPDAIEISAAAPLAAERGHWSGTGPNGAPAFGGTYLAMWRRTADGWKIRSELFVVLTCADEAACAAYRK
jgi:ketosteroid isomerase-like protein